MQSLNLIYPIKHIMLRHIYIDNQFIYTHVCVCVCVCVIFNCNARSVCPYFSSKLLFQDFHCMWCSVCIVSLITSICIYTFLTSMSCSGYIKFDNYFVPTVSNAITQRQVSYNYSTS